MSLYPEIIGKEAVCAAVKVKEGKIPRANGYLFLSVLFKNQYISLPCSQRAC